LALLVIQGSGKTMVTGEPFFPKPSWVARRFVVRFSRKVQIMKKDATFKWDDKDFVEFYTDSANFIVLERQRSVRILLEIVAFHFPSLSGLHILDLGCGEGIITKYIYDKSPDNNFYLLDASEEMLNKARGNLTSSKSNISFSHRTFEDYS